MTIVQIFGVKGSAATRAAERFFKERRAQIQLVDLKQKSMAPGELRRFTERFGLEGILDVESKAYADAGLKYLRLAPAGLIAKIEKEPKLLKLPLVRAGAVVSVGEDPAAWTKMLELAEKR